MHTRIGPSGAVNGYGCLSDMGKGLFEFCLNRMAMRLALPAAKAAAVIFNGECVTQDLTDLAQQGFRFGYLLWATTLNDFTKRAAG